MGVTQFLAPKDMPMILGDAADLAPGHYCVLTMCPAPLCAGVPLTCPQDHEAQEWDALSGGPVRFPGHRV